MDAQKQYAVKIGNKMGTLEAFLVIMAVISGGLVVWSYTKSGKKWLNSL